MSNCIYCHQRVQSGGDRHGKGMCPAKAKTKEKNLGEVAVGDLAPARGAVVAGAGKTSQELSAKGKSRGSKSG